MPDTYGIPREFSFPAVHHTSIRTAHTKEPLHLCQRALVLYVPHADPLNTSLLLDGQAIQAFARWTPTARGAIAERPSISIQVSRDRTQVSSEAGHSALTRFLSGEVRSVFQGDGRRVKTWTIEVLPGVEHVIVLERERWPGRLVWLSIDGKVLVEASAENLGCQTCADDWYCEFTFVGQKTLDFEVNEVSRFRNTLDSRSVVQVPVPTLHNCSINVQRSLRDPRRVFDIPSAILTVDGQPFAELPPKEQPFFEPSLAMASEVLKAQYDIDIPQKVNFDAGVKEVSPLQSAWHAAAAVGDTVTTPLAWALTGDTFGKLFAKNTCGSTGAPWTLESNRAAYCEVR